MSKIMKALYEEARQSQAELPEPLVVDTRTVTHYIDGSTDTEAAMRIFAGFFAAYDRRLGAGLWGIAGEQGPDLVAGPVERSDGG